MSATLFMRYMKLVSKAITIDLLDILKKKSDFQVAMAESVEHAAPMRKSYV